jgi:hypothetical protein
MVMRRRAGPVVRVDHEPRRMRVREYCGQCGALIGDTWVDVPPPGAVGRDAALEGRALGDTYALALAAHRCGKGWP